MTTLQEKIDELPPLPDKRGWDGHVYSSALPYRARLALAREWIAGQWHGEKCLFWKRDMAGNRYGNPDGRCTCGRDALLAALGEPNE